MKTLLLALFAVVIFGCGSSSSNLLAPQAQAQAPSDSLAPRQRVVLIGRFQDDPNSGVEFHFAPFSSAPVQGGPATFNVAGRAYQFRQDTGSIRAFEAYGCITDEVFKVRLTARDVQGVVAGSPSSGGYDVLFSDGSGGAPRRLTLATAPQIRPKYTLGQGVLAGATDVFTTQGDMVSWSDSSSSPHQFIFTLNKSNGDGSFSGIWGNPDLFRKPGTATVTPLSFDGSSAAIEAWIGYNTEFKGTFKFGDLDQGPAGLNGEVRIIDETKVYGYVYQNATIKLGAP